MLEMLANGVVNILTPGVLLCLLGGVTVGLILGAIPGLSATMAIALVIPFTYYLTPTQAIVMCLGAFNGGCFAHAPENVFHQRKNKTRINNHQRIAAKRFHFENIDTGRHRKGTHKFPKFCHINRNRGNFHAFAHSIG